MESAALSFPESMSIYYWVDRELFNQRCGWSGGAKVLGKLSVPGRPTNLEYSRARAYCACSRCGWGCVDIFSLVYHFSILSPSLWETARSRLNYCLKGPFNPKQPTNQPTVTRRAIQISGPLHHNLECLCASSVVVAKK